tara:strand:- start:383 stop:670 length:288 start_codon:yes stop_codon:yes gene_type:complete
MARTKNKMNHIQTIELLEEMQMRIDSLQHTIDKMIMSGKFKDNDPRFKSIEDNIHTMETMMMQVAIDAGIKPYNIHFPQSNKKYNEKKKNDKDQD